MLIDKTVIEEIGESRPRTLKNPEFGCFQYSDVWYSDGYCISMDIIAMLGIRIFTEF